MSRILVTGGAGYIGSHTCKALARAGFEPVTVDNLATGHRAAVRWGPLLELDLADRDAVRRLLERERFLAVIHLAGFLDVAESMRRPDKYYANNVINTLNLLNAMVAAGPRVVVFSSTGATYGMAEKVPIAEDHPQRPINPYGETKLAIERAIEWYGVAHGLQWASLRYFNAAGADPDGEIGEAHQPEVHLIPLVLGACLGTRPPVQVFGTDYPTPDGTAIRDYVHVVDLAEAHRKALLWLLDGGRELAVNLGTGMGRSVREILRAAATVTGVEPPFTECDRRLGDPPALVADPARANETLRWRPRHSDLPTILETAYRWHRQHQEPV